MVQIRKKIAQKNLHKAESKNIGNKNFRGKGDTTKKGV